MYSTTSAGHPASPNTTQLLFPVPTQSGVSASPDVHDLDIPDAATIPDADTLPELDSTDTVETQDTDADSTDTPDRLQDITDVIEFCKLHNFPADVVGRWVWIKFPDKPDYETRELLKSAGFRWVKIRGQWAHNCGYHSRRGKGNLRWKYGSIPVSAITRDDLKVLKGVA